MKKIYIVTAHTGYNYGTYLQAYAMKQLMSRYCDSAEIIWEKSFGPNGRDYRIKKIVAIGMRSVRFSRQAAIVNQGYKKNLDSEPNVETKCLFDQFSKSFLDIQEYSLHNLRKIALDADTKAVVCGSDQIWNADAIYPDPLYYLQFAPKEKRIAYAPSFGRTEVPSYNQKRLAAFIESIPHLSVREESGIDIIEKLTGRKSRVVPDPTIVVDWSGWISPRREGFLLLYFLDKPNEAVVEEIVKIQKMMGVKVKVLLHTFSSFEIIPNVELIHAGPKEFVETISAAGFVCTDSFHATIFSLLSSTPFYTYQRNYGAVSDQSGRVVSLLTHFRMESRLRRACDVGQPLVIDCDFSKVEHTIKEDFECSDDYLTQILDNL